MPERTTVLLAEDDDNDVLLMKRAFAKATAAEHLRVVRDGQEVIDYLLGVGHFSDRATHPLPHLIILDLKMPRKNGFEVLEWVKTEPRFKRIPVVVLTSSSQPRDITRAYDLHANSYLVKPNAFEQLVALIASTEAYWLQLNRPSI
jgi:CheY-like chemotaxis protein